MSKTQQVAITKGGISILVTVCILMLCWLLYPSFRYQTASIGKTEIRYDRLTHVIYFRNSLNKHAEWLPTKYKTIMETKYDLARQELEDAINELTQKNQQNPGKAVSLKRTSQHLVRNQ